MKTLIKFSFIILAGIYYAPAYSQIDKGDNMNIYAMCAAETKHTKLYDFGKKLAEGWLYWVANPKYGEKKSPVKTKQSFFIRAQVGYNDKNKITETGEFSSLYFCYMGYASNVDSVPWSSVHSGLVDYLPAKHKAKFLSLPER